MKSLKFDTIMAMNLMGLGVLSSGYAANLMINDIPAMTQQIAKPQPKLKPVFIELTDCNEIMVTSDGLDVCVDGDNYAPIDPALYLPIVASK